MKTKKTYRSKLMNPLCEQAGCSPEDANKHAWKWERRHWHSHPPSDFCAWWNPYETDPTSGASVGGHPEARRVWARKDPGKWLRRRYGITAEQAYNTRIFREEFEAWTTAGSPEQNDFISICATLEHQRDFWRDIKPTLAQIGKKVEA